MKELCTLWGFEEAVWLLWDCLWSSGGLPQGDVVLDMVWPLPSGLASGPLRILNEHFWL